MTRTGKPGIAAILPLKHRTGPRCHTRRSATVAVLLFGALFLTACGNRNQYIGVHAFPHGQWAAADTVRFAFHPRDTVAPQTIELVLEYRKDFPWGSLPLEIRGVIPGDSIYWADTLCVLLNAPGGLRLGTEYPSHYEHTVMYRTGIRYGRSALRTVEVRQISGTDPLEGISSLTLKASGCCDTTTCRVLTRNYGKK